MIYEILFWVGVLGVVAQSVLGFAHGHGHGGHDHAGHSHGHGHVGGDHGVHAGHHHGVVHHGGADQIGAAVHHAGGAAAHGHGAHVGGDHGGHAAHHAGHVSGDHAHATAAAHEGAPQAATAGARASILDSPLLGLLSPLTLFSLALGGGLTGLFLRAYLAPFLTALLAAAGAVAFYGLIVRPLFGLILSFASKPATALAGVVAGEARAVSRFDEKGQGVVSVNIDGQIVRLLAHLEAEDRQKGVTVAPGETLVVTSVDGPKNICKVTRL